MAHEPAPTLSISRYRIISKIGAGGMGEVYLAEDARLGRQVALKVMAVDIADDGERFARFEQEAKAASALNHPNILTVYEFGEEDGVHFLASELVRGCTVREILATGELDLRQALKIAEQTAFALDAAHSSGIVHRDIKPENLMVRDDGIVKVLDFGLAKLVEHPETQPDAETRIQFNTAAGHIVGTSYYMSPEQARGRGTIDGRTDVWSLGVVLYEMASGRPPFTGETTSDVIAGILKTEPTPLSAEVPECPPEMDRIVSKALQKDREERYQTVKDLAIDLRSLRRGVTSSGQLTSSPAAGLATGEISATQTVATAFWRRKYVLPGFVGMIALIAIGFFFGPVLFNYATGRSAGLDPASFRSVDVVTWTSQPGEVYSRGKFSPDGRMVAFESTRGGSRQLWMKQTAAGEPVQITKDEFTNEQPIWSPNGEELAFFSSRGNQPGLWRIPILGGAPKLIASLGDGAPVLRLWARSGLIYFESKNDLYAGDSNTGEVRQVTQFDAAVSPKSIVISVDERHLAYTTVVDGKWNLWTRPLSPEKPPKPLVTGKAEIRNTAWYPDGSRVIYSSPVDGTFQIFAADVGGSPPQQLSAAERDCFAVDVSSDAGRILYGSAKEESDVWGVGVKDSKETQVASDIDAELWPSVSPGGKLIAYQSVKNLSQGNNLVYGTIYIRPLSGSQPPTELARNAHLAVWSPDGQKVAFVEIFGDKYRLATASPAGGSHRVLTDGIGSLSHALLPYNRTETSDISWSPDAGALAFISSKDGRRNVSTIRSEGLDETRLTDNAQGIGVYCPLWSPDGKRIAFTRTETPPGKPKNYAVMSAALDGPPPRVLHERSSPVRLLAWSADGRHLLLAAAPLPQKDLQAEVSIMTLDTESGNLASVAQLKDAYFFNIYPSPNGESIAFATRRDGRDNIWLIPRDGSRERLLTNNNDSRLLFSSLAWSPDGNMIYFGKQLRYSLLTMLTNQR